MKSMFCAVILSAVAILSVKGMREAFPCWSWGNIANYKNLYQEVPKTRSFKCLYHCRLEYDGLLKEDGLIDVNKFYDMIDHKMNWRRYKDVKETLPKMLREVMEGLCKNHKHLSEDKCETVGLLLQCTVDEFQKRGMNQVFTLHLFTHPSYGAADALFFGLF